MHLQFGWKWICVYFCSVILGWATPPKKVHLSCSPLEIKPDALPQRAFLLHFGLWCRRCGAISNVRCSKKKGGVAHEIPESHSSWKETYFPQILHLEEWSKGLSEKWEGFPYVRGWISNSNWEERGRAFLFSFFTQSSPLFLPPSFALRASSCKVFQRSRDYLRRFQSAYFPRLGYSRACRLPCCQRGRAHRQNP